VTALVEFRSVVELRCAIEMQNGMVDRNAGLPSISASSSHRHPSWRCRRGEGRRSDGDGVNIAARLEGVATPGAICLSEDAYRQVKARLDLAVNDLGARDLKNIADPIRIYSLQVGLPAEVKPVPKTEPAASVQQPAPLVLPDKPSIAILAFQNMSGDSEQEFCRRHRGRHHHGPVKAHWLFVIARNSSFTYKGKSVDMSSRPRTRRSLCARRQRAKGGNRVRITAQLIDAGADSTSGRSVTTARSKTFLLFRTDYPGIIGAIAPGIVAAEIQRTQGKKVTELGQWERVMRAPGMSRVYPRGLQRSNPLIEEILRRDRRMRWRSPTLLTTGIWVACLAGQRNLFPWRWSRARLPAARSLPTTGRGGANFARRVRAVLDQHDDAIRRLVAR
jgi:TolB-like protein